MQKVYLNIVKNEEKMPVSTHSCYIIKSTVTNRIYIGYTVDFKRRLRQHNGEIVGGAKKTQKGRPWIAICLMEGFYEQSSAMRFEYRLQHCKLRNKKNRLKELIQTVIENGDGVLSWPELIITWY